LWNGKNSTQKIHFKNLTKRKKTILFKIEHLIHLTKKGNNEFWFFYVSKCFYVHDNKVGVWKIIIIYLSQMKIIVK